MATWEEVRKLAADFQRIQHSSTAHKLSERSCVEVVAKLVEMKLVDVIYTLDGKEYITPQYLEREIIDELRVHRGRINVVDLHQLLNVDLFHVETKVKELLKYDKSLVLIQGDLIEISYLDHLAEEVNDTLQESGHVSLNVLSLNFMLPLKFLVETLKSHLGTIIQGQFDDGENILYTDSYVARHRARIRGIFSAATRPTALSPILSQGGFQDSLFHTVLRELTTAGELKGTLYGRLENAKFIPDVYSVMQKKWVESFFTSNGYLEFDALSRLGIDDPVSYIKNHYSNSDVILLKTCCIGYSITAQVSAAIEEAKCSQSWVDILPLLPSPCNDADGEILLGKQISGNMLKYGSIATSRAFVQSCIALFRDAMETRAQKDVSKNPSLLSEISAPPKGAEKRDRKRNARQAERKTAEIKFLDAPQIVTFLEEKLPDCSDEFIEAMAQDIERPLTEEYLKMLETSFDLLKKPSTVHHRKLHATLETLIQELWTQFKLFEKAIPYFQGEPRVQASKYLLNTLCSDMVTKVVRFVAEDHMVTVDTRETSMTPEERIKLTSQLPPQIVKQLKPLETSLRGKDLDTFSQIFEMVCNMEFCGILLKKLDKKKERHLLFTHRQSLMEKVEYEEDPAMTLHLVTVLLFQQHTSCMLHAPGRMVPSIVAVLEKYLPEKEQQVLLTFQQQIIKYITAVRNKEEADKSNMQDKTGSDNVKDDQQVEDTVEDTSSVKPLVDEDSPTSLLAKLNDGLPVVKALVAKKKE